MQQNYTIFLKDRPLRIVHNERAKDVIWLEANFTTTEFQPGEVFRQTLSQNIKQLLNGTIPFLRINTFDTSVVLDEVKFSTDMELDAAGGAVFNNQQQLLCIYRRGFWDLPKGKVDEGETVVAAAVREVQEETGIQQIKLGARLLKTYHIYEEKGKTIFKTTHWYLMQTSETVLLPQAEEDITKAEWVSPGNMGEIYGNTYENVKTVIGEALHKMGF